MLALTSSPALSYSQALALVPLYLVSVGGVLNTDGQYLYNYYTNSSKAVDYEDYLWVEFGGALGALFFCVSP